MKKRVFGLVVVAVFISSLAVAADKEEAKRLFESGLKLMKVDDFAAAAANFERSSALYPTQNGLFNLANCYKALQRYAESLDVLRRLHHDFGDKLNPEIKEEAVKQEAEIRSIVATLVVKVAPRGARVALDGRDVGAAPVVGPLLLSPGDHTIEATLAGYRAMRRSVRLVSGADQTERFTLEIEPGYLMVRTEPNGAVVLVDGEEKTKTPLPQALALSPGNHVIALRLEGRRQAERQVEIQAGERQALEIALAALDAAEPAASSSPEKATSSGTALTPTLADASKAKPRTRFWRILAWSSSAGAVATGGTAMVFWKVLGDGRFAAAKKYANPKDPQAQIALNDANRYGDIAIGCGIGAGALAVTALVAFLADSSEDKSGRTTSVSLSPFGVGVRF
jgi:tetratricopeptide (TPR) repeat protein